MLPAPTDSRVLSLDSTRRDTFRVPTPSAVVRLSQPPHPPRP